MTTLICECVNTAVENIIPHYSPTTNNKNNIPGWNEHVKPYKEAASFWYAVWRSAGRPLNTVLHDVMKSTRNKYHYAIRHIRKQDTLIRKNNFVRDLNNGNVLNTFRTIKNMRNVSSCVNIVDGKTSDTEIANHFKSIYDNLYNTHNDNTELDNFTSELNHELRDDSYQEIDRLSPHIISKLIKRMKRGKNDMHYTWRSDALKVGVEIISTHICELFKMFLIHNHVTQTFLNSALIPIIKDRNRSHADSSNYRAIAISSLIMKLLDYTIVELYPLLINTSEFQFGFKSKCSTTLCSWAVVETVNYFTSRGGTVYSCFLDLRKAFDLVILSKLFNKLKNKLPPIFIRLIITSYKKQKCLVRWNNLDSDMFTTSNGVRQGASISPILFALYIDNLFLELKNSGLGCHIDNVFIAVFGYADDICLLSPSRQGLQDMVNICQKYFEEHGIEISCDRDEKKSKTKCIIFNGKTKNPTPIMLKDTPIPYTDCYKHLGHFINNEENMVKDMNAKCGEFISSVHSLRQELGYQDVSVFLNLVNIYCASFYGSNLWDLSSAKAVKLWGAWQTLLRTSYDLPPGTHRYLLNAVYGKPHLKVMLLKKFVKFHKQVSTADQEIIRVLYRKQNTDVRSIFGRNCNYVRTACNVQHVSDAKFNNELFFPQPPGSDWTIETLKELLSVRNFDLKLIEFDEDELNEPINFFDEDELNEIINFLCTA